MMANMVFFCRSKDDDLHLKSLKRKVDETLRHLPRQRLLVAQFKAFLLPGLYMALYVFTLFNADKVLLYFLIYGSMGLVAVLVPANDYLKGNNNLSIKENRKITPEEIVDNFAIKNTLDFLKRNYTR